jgi:hypothetical protein
MRRTIRQAFAEIDPRQMAIESEQQRHPDLPPHEIHRRAMARFMRKSEWEPGLWEAVFGPNKPTENEDT